MKLSIIMVTMNREKIALRSLSAVLKQTLKPREIIVIDSSDDDKLGKSGKKLLSKSKIKFVYVHRKASMTEARNIGIKIICSETNIEKNDIILFIDDDVVIYPDYIKNLIVFYDEHPDAGGACGYLCDDNKFLIDRWSKFPHVPSMDDPFTIQGMHGSNMSFRIAIFDEFIFNENLRGYYADDDEFSARVSNKYKLYLVPYIRCVHEHTSTGGARLDPFTDFNTMIFNRYYIYKNRRKTLFNFLHYLFSDALILFRIFLYHRHKAMALRGALRGYHRVLNNMGKNDITSELGKL